MGFLLTAKGREIAMSRIHGAGTEPLNLGWGKNPNALTAAVSDVALFAPAAEARVAGTASITTTTTTNDTYQVVGTITSLSTQTIAEVGLFDSATAAPTTTVTGGTAVGSSSGTTLTVTSATGFPGSGNYDFQVRGEVMTVTAGQGTTSWTVTRGANGSTAIATIANTDAVTGGNQPGSTAVTGGSCFIHGDHGANSLNASDSVTYTLTLKIT